MGSNVYSARNTMQLLYFIGGCLQPPRQTIRRSFRLKTKRRGQREEGERGYLRDCRGSSLFRLNLHRFPLRTENKWTFFIKKDVDAPDSQFMVRLGQ